MPMPKNHRSPLTTVERRSEILDVLQREGNVRVQDICKQFHVSEVTIRNDLKVLGQKGLVHRTHGGAIRSNFFVKDLPVEDKKKKQVEEKRRIGKGAAALVQDGETVILDSGTTTMEIARNLGTKKNLTIITNAINIAWELAQFEKLKVILTGGIMRPESYSLVGPHAESTLRKHFVEKFFLGVDGFHVRYGLTTPNVLEAQLNKQMIEISRETIVVADSSKFGVRSFSLIADVSKISKVVTDSGIPEEDLSYLVDNGIEVIIA
ncbi:MAG: transcriptional repressor AgaR [bacterium]